MKPSSGEIRYGEDLTADDLAGAIRFLRHQMRPTADGALPSDWGRTAQALWLLVCTSNHSIRHCMAELSARQEVLNLPRPHPYPERFKAMLMDEWNRIYSALYQWRDQEGFDSARWRHLMHWDAQEEALYQRLIGKNAEGGETDG